MAIRFILPDEVERLRRNVLTAFPSKTPQASLDDMPRELASPDEGRYLGYFDDSGENRAYDGVIQEIGRRNMGCMCRVLNVRRYFEGQSHCQSAVSRPFVLQLRVTDNFYPQNACAYRLCAEGVSPRRLGRNARRGAQS